MPQSGALQATAVLVQPLYAARRGRRLPTGVEIEKAGRGVDGRFTPWGDVEETRWSRVARSLPRPAALISVHAFRTAEFRNLSEVSEFDEFSISLCCTIADGSCRTFIGEGSMRSTRSTRVYSFREFKPCYIL